ncbi:MAG: folate-binding protein [Ghiorsea sp.]
MTLKIEKITKVKIAHRTSFSVVKASGAKVLDYLQGQITQDMKTLSNGQALYAVILNHQAKAVTDFYLLQGEVDEVIFLCPSDQAVVLVDRLKRFALGYTLRIGVVSPWLVESVQGGHVDDYLKDNQLPVPSHDRLAAVTSGGKYVLRMDESLGGGVWIIGEGLSLEPNVGESALEEERILKGVPKFGVDWDGKIHPLNASLMERGGVSFDKGCYVGQEVTSRMHWRGGIKKKLYRVSVEGLVGYLPCPVLTTAKVGELSSLATDQEGKQLGIALLPIEVVESGKKLSLEGGQKVTVLGVCV